MRREIKQESDFVLHKPVISLNKHPISEIKQIKQCECGLLLNKKALFCPVCKASTVNAKVADLNKIEILPTRQPYDNI